jgi:hypothetical protein
VIVWRWSEGVPKEFRRSSEGVPKEFGAAGLRY